MTPRRLDIDKPSYCSRNKIVELFRVYEKLLYYIPSFLESYRIEFFMKK